MNASGTILIPTSAATAALKRELPDPSANLFARLSGNSPLGSSPRERYCAEMLACLLINCPAVCSAFSEYLGKLTSFDLSGMEICRWEIETEQSIGTKRDDLRMCGWVKDGASEKLHILWTVEIKVGADFHWSTAYSDDGVMEEVAVHQVRNYDRWLSRQKAAVKGGFVLALEDKTCALPKPEDLDCGWRCLTWTELGRLLYQLLKDPIVPAPEKFLCRHVLGFIVARLWRSAEMPDSRIEFDDVALLRAMATMGKDCQTKVGHLVEGLATVFEAVGIGKGECKTHNTLFGKWGVYSVSRPLISTSEQWPNVGAGITQDYLAVWIESGSSYKKRAALRSLHDQLVIRNADWELLDAPWWDFYLGVPLTQLLSASNQLEVAQDFVKKALSDLLAVGIEKVVAK